MSQFIPEEAVQEVLLRADIVDVLSDYVQLKKTGTNYKGLCPFHTEKTPSFTVNPSKGLFYCFGCQAGGNTVRFLMQHEHLAFPEALRLLALRYGVRLPEPSSGHQPDALQPFYDLHQAATTFFHQALLRHTSAQKARAYCRQRQINSDIATRFALGYAPDSWDALCQDMQRQGFGEELLVRSGLVIARERKGGVYDRFRNRLIFPIYDRLGRPIAFGGRYLDGADAPHAPKYLNSPETPIFHKGRTLYGLHLANQAIRREERAIIVEGYTDVITCHLFDITHVVGTLGTALTERHVEMLRGLVKEVILVFDSDAAGGAATERGIGLFLEAGVRVRIVALPEGDDPDSFLKRQGREAFLQQIHGALTFLEYLLARARRFYDLQSPEGRADCVARILPLLRKIDNQVEQWGYVTLLAKKIGVPTEVLQRDIQTDSDRKSFRRYDREPSFASPTASLPRVEYDLLRLLLHDGSALEEVRHQITPDDFHAPILRDIYGLLLRLIPKGEATGLPHLLERADDDAQRQLLAKMVAEPVPITTEGYRKALDDYVVHMQQRRIQTRLDKLKADIRDAEQRRDTTAQQRLLEAYATLRQELQSKRVFGKSF